MSDNNIMDRGREILAMSVEIGDGRCGNIAIHEFDIPRQLAIDFCKEYNLADNTVEILTAHIVDNIDQLIKEEGGTSINNSPQHAEHQQVYQGTYTNRTKNSNTQSMDQSPNWKYR